ncbi:MAG: PepSY domain-containing protein, partial [Cellulosilyticaceae bacterium]
FNRALVAATFLAVGSMAVSVMGATTIGAQKAKEVAVSHAKLNTKDVAFTQAKLDTDDGRVVYEIEFYHNGVEYDYEIGAVDGKVKEVSLDGVVKPAKPVTKPVTKPAPAKGTIGAQKAKEIALAHAKLNAKDAVFTKAKLDTDDGHVVYEIEFYSKGLEYSYEIGAATGTIVDFEVDED